jgi:hypothetical protein
MSALADGERGTEAGSDSEKRDGPAMSKSYQGFARHKVSPQSWPKPGFPCVVFNLCAVQSHSRTRRQCQR